jgi:tetratricopeptide (TPR) repeat protein
MRSSRRETAEAVEELVRHRLLATSGERFDFTHARLRQAVYGALLAPRRQALHAAVGEALESVHADRLDAHYDLLAHHFSRADEPGRALTYLVHLADQAGRSYALEEAVRVLRDALVLTDRLPIEERGGRRLEVVFRLASALGNLGRPVEGRDLLLQHEDLVTGLRQPRLSGIFHFWLAYLYGNLGNASAGLAHARQALEEAARAGDNVIMGRASYALAREGYMMGTAREGIAHARNAVALLEGTEERWWLGQALGMLGLLLFHFGDFGPALEIMERMRALAEELNDVRLQAEAAWTTTRIHTVSGEVEAGVTAGQRAVALAADPVAKAIAIGWLGAASVEAGDGKAALAQIEEALERLQQLSGAGGYRYRQLDGMLRALLAETHLGAGHVEAAHPIAAEALAVAYKGGWPIAIAYAERAVGRVALAAGRLDEAERALRAALDTFTAIEARAQAARSRLPLGELHAARGNRDAAAAELRAAHGLFTQMRAPRMVERVSRLAASLGMSLESTRLVCRDALPNVTGEACEALLLQAHYYRGQLVNEASVLFLRLAGGWHRIFIEAGVVFWHTVDSLDSPDADRHHYTVTDLGAGHGLVGKRLIGITTADVPAGGELRLLFSGDLRVSLRHVDGRSRVVVEGGP